MVLWGVNIRRNWVKGMEIWCYHCNFSINHNYSKIKNSLKNPLHVTSLTLFNSFQTKRKSTQESEILLLPLVHLYNIIIQCLVKLWGLINSESNIIKLFEIPRWKEITQYVNKVSVWPCKTVPGYMRLTWEMNLYKLFSLIKSILPITVSAQCWNKGLKIEKPNQFDYLPSCIMQS